MKTLIFDISHLVQKPTGSSEIYTFEGPAKFDEIDTKSDISGKVKIMRIEEGVNVELKEAKLKISLNCDRCLKKITYLITLEPTERQFLFEKPGEIDDINDLYLIDKKHLNIDLTEMMRQEILLHFPINPVCSLHCKGVCAYCGIDKNKRKCSCKEEIPKADNPFEKLKELIK